MSKSVRSLLDEEEGRNRMLTAFAVPDDLFPRTISESSLWNLLDEASAIRNEQKGHGGVAGPAQHEEVHGRLRALLARLMPVLSPCLGETVLIRPGGGNYRRGITTYKQAQVLQGENSHFRQQVIVTSVSQLDAEELYLLSTRERVVSAALPLVPLLRLRDAPAGTDNACYFYSRMTANEVQFVSHHFDGAPHITEPDADVIALVTSLQPSSEKAG